MGMYDDMRDDKDAQMGIEYTSKPLKKVTTPPMKPLDK